MNTTGAGETRRKRAVLGRITLLCVFDLLRLDLWRRALTALGNMCVAFSVLTGFDMKMNHEHTDEMHGEGYVYSLQMAFCASEMHGEGYVSL